MFYPSFLPHFFLKQKTLITLKDNITRTKNKSDTFTYYIYETQNEHIYLACLQNTKIAHLLIVPSEKWHVDCRLRNRKTRVPQAFSHKTFLANLKKTYLQTAQMFLASSVNHWVPPPKIVPASSVNHCLLLQQTLFALCNNHNMQVPKTFLCGRTKPFLRKANVFCCFFHICFFG